MLVLERENERQGADRCQALFAVAEMLGIVTTGHILSLIGAADYLADLGNKNASSFISWVFYQAGGSKAVGDITSTATGTGLLVKGGRENLKNLGTFVPKTKDNTMNIKKEFDKGKKK